jgi:hypothetical protein
MIESTWFKFGLLLQAKLDSEPEGSGQVML